LVQCIAKRRQRDEYVEYVPFEQQVETMDAILERQMEEAKKEKAPHPYTELIVLQKWYSILEELGNKYDSKMSDAVKAAHNQRLSELRRYREQLESLQIQKYDFVLPFYTTYLATESMEDMDLRVFFAHEPKKNVWMIVDWTNLDEKRLHGEYKAIFEGMDDASIDKHFEKALRQWELGNRYWPGGIKYDFKWGSFSKSGRISTDGKNFVEKLAEFLQNLFQSMVCLLAR